jgi:hypothetical protein
MNMDGNAVRTSFLTLKGFYFTIELTRSPWETSLIITALS